MPKTFFLKCILGKDKGGDRTEKSQLFFVKLFSYTAVAVVTDRIAKNPAGLEYLPCLFPR